MTPNPPGLEYAFSVHLEMTPGSLQRIEGLPGGGARWSINVAGGTFEGPRLRGKVLPGGIENPHFRPDMALMIDARWLLQEDDGTVILVRNRGIRRGHTRAKMQAWITRSEPVVPEDFYFRVVPTFETSDGKHAWLTENVFIGVLGERPRERKSASPGPTMHYFRVL